MPDAAPVVEQVKVLPPPPPAMKIAEPSAALMAKVLFNFAGTGKNEMALTQGELVEVIQRGKPGAWTKGLRGSFPTDYVQFVEPAPAPAGMSTSNSGSRGSMSDPFALVASGAGAQNNSSNNILRKLKLSTNVLLIIKK